jgi:hypothetical protein
MARNIPGARRSVIYLSRVRSANFILDRLSAHGIMPRMSERNAPDTRSISGPDIAVAVSIPVLKAFARFLPEAACA